MEVTDVVKDEPKIPELPDIKAITADTRELVNEWADYAHSLEEYAKGEWGDDYYEENFKEVFDEFWKTYDEFNETLKDISQKPMESSERLSEAMEAREYGIKEGAEVACRCFTPEIIQNWGNMSLEERNQVLQEYAVGIGKALDIDFKGIVWREFPTENGRYTFGENSGDGWLHLNVECLANPADLMRMVDTIAHEARHQFQFEAMQNPEKYPIDDAAIKEWMVGNAVYTTELPSAYDPWGYTYNPTETDARYYGEAMVRELTKYIINQA